MNTKTYLSRYIYKKLYIYLSSFNRLPNSLVISKEDYEIIKDNDLIKQLNIHFNYVPYPILYYHE